MPELSLAPYKPIQPQIVSDRASPWGEVWWGDMSNRFPFGETIFATSVRSLEIQYDLAQDPNPETKGTPITIEKWAKNEFGPDADDGDDNWRRVSSTTHFRLPPPDADVDLPVGKLAARGVFKLPYDHIWDPQIELSRRLYFRATGEKEEEGEGKEGEDEVADTVAEKKVVKDKGKGKAVAKKSAGASSATANVAEKLDKTVSKNSKPAPWNEDHPNSASPSRVRFNEQEEVGKQSASLKDTANLVGEEGAEENQPDEGGEEPLYEISDSAQPAKKAKRVRRDVGDEAYIFDTPLEDLSQDEFRECFDEKHNAELERDAFDLAGSSQKTKRARTRGSVSNRAYIPVPAEDELDSDEPVTASRSRVSKRKTKSASGPTKNSLFASDALVASKHDRLEEGNTLLGDQPIKVTYYRMREGGFPGFGPNFSQTVDKSDPSTNYSAHPGWMTGPFAPRPLSSEQQQAEPITPWEQGFRDKIAQRAAEFPATHTAIRHNEPTIEDAPDDVDTNNWHPDCAVLK